MKSNSTVVPVPGVVGLTLNEAAQQVIAGGASFNLTWSIGRQWFSTVASDDERFRVYFEMSGDGRITAAWRIQPLMPVYECPSCGWHVGDAVPVNGAR